MPTTVDDVVGRLEPFGSLTRAEVRDLVLVIGGQYEQIVEADREAPRQADVRRWVYRTAERARALRQALEEAPREALLHLCGNDRVLGGARDPERIAGILRELDNAAEVPLAPDPGGQSNVERARHGHPKLWLAGECFLLFGLCRPDDVTTTEEGPLHDFTEAMLDSVSDEDEQRGTMLPHLKRAVREWRRVGAARARRDELDIALYNIRRFRLGREATEQEWRARDQEYRELLRAWPTGR